jgi:tight adherence protein B
VTDYNGYHYAGKEKLKYLLQGVIIIFVLGYLFYKHLLGILLLIPLVYFYMQGKKRSLIRDRKWKLNLEFRDGILALSAALEAGYSAENAIEEARKDLGHIYPEDAMIIQELSYMVNQIRMNVTVEKVLEDFAIRSQVEDILSFSEVFNTAKRTGGDLISVIKLTGNVISDKIEVKREIITLITAKRMEANIMKGIPVLILIYLSLSSPGFLSPLYHNVFGAIVMSVLLLFYLGAFLVIERIVAIEV